MKVRQLIKELQELDQDSEVIIASDGEGNDLNELSEVTDDNTYFARVLEKDKEFGDFEREGQIGELEDFLPEDQYTKPVKCIVLFP